MLTALYHNFPLDPKQLCDITLYNGGHFEDCISVTVSVHHSEDFVLFSISGKHKFGLTVDVTQQFRSQYIRITVSAFFNVPK